MKKKINIIVFCTTSRLSVYKHNKVENNIKKKCNNKILILKKTFNVRIDRGMVTEKLSKLYFHFIVFMGLGRVHLKGKKL